MNTDFEKIVEKIVLMCYAGVNFGEVSVKYSSLAAFDKHLEGAAPKHFADIYLIMGKESFARKLALDHLSALYLKNDPSPALSVIQFDAEKCSVKEVLAELDTLAMFSKRRLIVVHNCDAFDKASTLKLESYCESPNRAICVAFSTTGLNRSTTFYKKLEKVGVVVDIPEEKPWEKEKSMVDWLQGEAVKQGKQLPQQAAQILVKQLGTDQLLLSNELNKLICYVGVKTAISDKDIAAICSVVGNETGWQLGEAIFRKDPAASLRISKSLLADGLAVIALLRQIRSQFQTQYQIGCILAGGGTPADVAGEYPYMKGQILERNVRVAQTYGMEKFKLGILAIDEAELQAKNSMTDPEFLVERLIIKLTV